MRLKLDLHPIYNDSIGIERELQRVIDEAVAKGAKEVEIIPGKGSGALKKTVIRFLQRPEVKSRYHRLEKDSDNWGRLFIHFRHDRSDTSAASPPDFNKIVLRAPCACCGELIETYADEDERAGVAKIDCPACGSPNRFAFRRDRRDDLHIDAELDYDEG